MLQRVFDKLLLNIIAQILSIHKVLLSLFCDISVLSRIQIPSGAFANFFAAQRNAKSNTPISLPKSKKQGLARPQ